MTNETPIKKFGGQKGGTMLAPQVKEWITAQGHGELLAQLIALKEKYAAEHKPVQYDYMKAEKLQQLYAGVKARAARMETAAARRGITL